MHRVSSTFGDHLPSHGLLLLRVIVAIALIARCVQLVNGASLQTFTPHVIAAGAGLFLLFGLWTSVAGAIVAIIELFIAFSQGHDPWLSVLLASLGVALRFWAQETGPWTRGVPDGSELRFDALTIKQSDRPPYCPERASGRDPKEITSLSFLCNPSPFRSWRGVKLAAQSCATPGKDGRQ